MNSVAICLSGVVVIDGQNALLSWTCKWTFKNNTEK